jgi:hypothetical protein
MRLYHYTSKTFMLSLGFIGFKQGLGVLPRVASGLEILSIADLV